MTSQDIKIIVNTPNMPHALCAQIDPEIFFPESTNQHGYSNAQKVCNACEHIDECREFAISEHIVYGVWGGTSPAAREDIRRRRGTRTYTPAELRNRRIERLVNAGATHAQIAEMIGIDRRQLQRILYKMRQAGVA